MNIATPLRTFAEPASPSCPLVITGAPVDRADEAGAYGGLPARPAIHVPHGPRWLRVGSMRISYVDVGDGPVVLLIHGLGHSTHGWRKNFAPLAADGYRVMAVDLPGFGYSDNPGDLTLEQYTDFIRDWLDLHCLEWAAVVGNSLGGLIAASFAARHPERLRALVLADAAGFGSRLSWPLRLATLAPSALVTRRTGPSARQVRRALKLVYHDAVRIEDEEVERIRELAVLPGNRDTFVRIGRGGAGLFKGMRPALGLGDLPVEIIVPTLVLWGRNDRVVPVSHAQKVIAACRDAELTIFENCGHCPMMEVPDQFNERVSRFLNERLATKSEKPGGSVVTAAETHAASPDSG